ncbi:hypothetical protein [Sphingobium sp. AP50]|uniref:hypothetical protein n=1 Tax=Sphingobium sp. AP50 TaxID=1884369 RepID=UPI0011606EFA|nr:hypothetical protein [Sphingobium sp. AP50]
MSDDPLSYGTLYTHHVEGAFIPKGKGKALHLLVKFPESVPVETREDAEAALKLAVDFAQHIFGGDAVFAARMDRDEKSLTNADLFLAPRYVKKTKHTEKIAISLSRHLKLMAEDQLGPIKEDKDILRQQGRALQDAFAKFLRARGFQAIRGQAKQAPEPDWSSPEAYGSATDRKIAAADREVAAHDRAEIEDRLVDQERELADKAVGLVKGLEDARQIGGDLIADGIAESDRIRDAAREDADTIRKQAEAEKERLLDAATQRSEQMATQIRDQAQADADAVAAKAKEARLEVEVAQRKRDEAIADRHAAEAAKEAARSDADIASLQLALVNRALVDDALELRPDDGERGILMNETAMQEPEREAYRARWADWVRTVARAAAMALAKTRAIAAAAKHEAERMIDAAKAKLADDRIKLAAERTKLSAEQIQLALGQKALKKQRAEVVSYLEIWEAIPPDRRSPEVNAAVERTSGLKQQAESLSAETRSRSKRRLSDVDAPAQAVRDWLDEGR